MNQDVRTRLLENALQLFSRKGFENVGVQEIAVSSGVTKPTLYHYFGSKRGLLETIFREKFAPLEAGLEALAAEPSTALETMLTRLAHLNFDFARDNPLFARLFFSMMFAPEESEPFQIASAHAKRQHQTLVRTLEGPLRAAGWQWDIGFAVGSFVGRLHNCISWFLIDHLPLDEHMVSPTVKGFLYGIVPPPS